MGELTLAFSLSAIEKLEDPRTVFEDGLDPESSLGVIDDDAEPIESVITEYDL